MASPGKDTFRMKSYKNKALIPQEMRRRREEEGIQLRKQKREEQVNTHLKPPDHQTCSWHIIPSNNNNTSHQISIKVEGLYV
ncbi:hypothetical protein F7725_018956 [Dissostichus mawsoni]|uniref:IBB domain-containing protein n=1 Tax=Dissostichus mawsoni TaxID=36200 RepID=A0A7J5XUT3_DISMA|nr:hypothetical protein F7725_018956 [Dissostichus mawsoni]